MKKKDLYSDKFIKSLKNHDLYNLRMIPKSDLHNHFVLGGSREYIQLQTSIEIPFIKEVLSSMQDMHKWNDTNIGTRFNTKEMRKLLIDATFVQAKIDGITILEIGEDVWGLGEFFNNDIDELINAFIDANQRIAPEIELRLQIGLSRHCPVNYLLKCLEHFWGHDIFYSIDLYGDEHAQPIENFIPIYKKAKSEGLRLKAHIGEWGTANDVKKGIELLELNEVQHGIAAVNSEEIIHFLIKNNIRLNITPTSNVKLGRVQHLKSHPIRKLYKSGVDVTINSDDILIFDSDVSKEYLRLYEAETLTAEELDNIRINGLCKVN
ncbi:adenosine deaminase [Sedimentibacter saalensis]|uniref:Adenosine deaminase n=1 Tax=Sedimentibacter saalensis TaxID=130788 RepID=A0A562JET0_9FIRM|nr:adenosine deaminase [Sedimentibacter saalensis]TWH81689.1 adenosine deaminase [Sedimentibacter saalensis]